MIKTNSIKAYVGKWTHIDELLTIFSYNNNIYTYKI